MDVTTDSPRAVHSQKMVLELLLADRRERHLAAGAAAQRGEGGLRDDEVRPEVEIGRAHV